MASCASASPAAPARLAVLADARLTDPGGWDAPASAGWDDPAGWDAALPDGDAAPPTDEELCGLAPDPYCDPPDVVAWAVDVPAEAPTSRPWPKDLV